MKLGVIGIAGAIAFGEMFALQAAEPPKQVEKITTAATTAPDRPDQPAGGPVRSGGKPTLNTPDQAKDQVASAAEPPKQVEKITTAAASAPPTPPPVKVPGWPKPTLNAPDKAKG